MTSIKSFYGENDGLKVQEKELIFELFDELKQLDMDILNEQHGWEFPQYIVRNLSMNHVLIKVKLFAIFTTPQASDAFTFRKLRQLMFNMATGSGKTDLMAATFLYLIKKKVIKIFCLQ